MFFQVRCEKAFSIDQRLFMNIIIESITGFLGWALVVGGLTLGGMAIAGLFTLVVIWLAERESSDPYVGLERSAQVLNCGFPTHGTQRRTGCEGRFSIRPAQPALRHRPPAYARRMQTAVVVSPAVSEHNE